MNNTDIILGVLSILIILYVWFGGDKSTEFSILECRDTSHILEGSEVYRVLNFNQDKPLSIRNNNPINIKRFNSNNWYGSNYRQGIFESFISPEAGLRASLIIIGANMEVTKSVKDFVERIVSKEAQNDLGVYTRHLSSTLGYRNKIKKQDRIKVLKAMIFLEGGNEAVEYFSKYFVCK